MMYSTAKNVKQIGNWSIFHHLYQQQKRRKKGKIEIFTIHQCEILGVLSQPSHVISYEDIVVIHAATTNPNCSHRTCKIH